MKNLPKFYTENLIEFSTHKEPFLPDSKLTSLRYGLQSYYETYSIFASDAGFIDYLHETTQHVILSNVKGHSYLMRYFASITFIHLSFEHFIIEILEAKSPVLSRLNLNKDTDLIKFLTGKISDFKTADKNNVDYYTALSRVQELILNHDSLPSNYQIDKKYHFLLNHIDTLKTLCALRNDIVHSGRKFLNRYVYELFFVNDVLPLIRKYIDSQPRTPLLERNIFCKKNVIDEISSMKLPENYKPLHNYQNLKKQLRRINHFKELGRASFKNPLHTMENVTSEDNRKSISQYVNAPQQKEAALHVQFRQDLLGHYKVYTCPCCGTDALTTFERWEVLANGKIQVHNAECVLCTYKININIGEPKEFGIMEKDIFIYVD